MERKSLVECLETPPRIKRALNLMEVYRKENRVILVSPGVQDEIWKSVYRLETPVIINHTSLT